jgi:glycine cleavage system H protein
MAEFPDNVKYARTHEWARLEEDGSITVGISDHAQEALGDIVYVELPEVGSLVASEGEAGVIESVKAASDLYAPVTGEIIEINDSVVDHPERVNASPYDDGWLFKISPSDVEEMEELLSADGYRELCDEDD